MGRRVQTMQLHAAGGGGGAAGPDTYFDKVVKYIPGDVVAAWVAVTGLVKMAPSSTLLWVSFVFGLVLTAAWTWKQTTVAGQPAAIRQILISTAAFAVWVYALGAPFDSLGWTTPPIPSLVLIGFTLAVGLFE